MGVLTLAVIAFSSAKSVDEKGQSLKITAQDLLLGLPSSKGGEGSEYYCGNGCFCHGYASWCCPINMFCDYHTQGCVPPYEANEQYVAEETPKQVQEKTQTPEKFCLGPFCI